MGNINSPVLFCLLLVLPQNAQDHVNQTLVLKDPTPRELNPEKKLGLSNPNLPPSTGNALAEYNRRRQELVSRASGQVYRLAETLHSAVRSHKPDASWTQERQLVDLIASLSRNIRVALTPPVSKGQTARGQQELPPPHQSDPASAGETAEQNTTTLLTLASDLQADTLRSGPDVISLRAIRDAEGITSLARRLGEQLRP